MKKKMIIIGGGVSGLSTGIFAQKNGFETEIYEKNNFVGGNLTGWFRNGCYIDNCIHWLNGSKDNTKLNALWREVGAIDDSTEFYQSDFFYVSEFENQKIGLGKDLEKTKQEMLKISPADKNEIVKFIECVKTYVKMCQKQNWFNGLSCVLKLFCNYKNSNLFEVSNKFKHPLLKKLFTDYILGEYSVYVLICAYGSFVNGDGKVPKDGCLEMAKRIQETYLKQGGKIFLNSPVKQIEIEKGKVKSIILKNGNKVEGDYFVCACDANVTFERLIDKKYMPKKLLKTYNNVTDFPVISAFHIAFSVKKLKTSLPDSFIFGTEPIKIGNTFYNRIMIKNYAYGKIFCENKDEIVIQLFLLQRETDYLFWSKLSELQYKDEKKKIISKISQIIKEKFEIENENLKFLDCWTPLTYKKYFDAYMGSFMSFGITKKLRTKISSKIKGVKNLFLATQWQTLFGGLPNALRSSLDALTSLGVHLPL